MKNCRLLTAGFWSLVLAGFCGSALALDDGPYIGASMGQATFEQKNLDDLDLDDESSAWKIFGGARWGILGIEGGWVDFGNAEDLQGSRDVLVEVSGWSGFGLISLPVGPVDLFAKFGGLYWDSESQVGNNLRSEDDIDIAWGLGGALRLGSFAIRLEYEMFEIDTLDDLNMYSIGATYTF